MSLFPWALIFLGLCLAGAGLLTLVGVRLWRNVKVLGRDATKLGESLSRLGDVGVARGYDANE